MRDRPEARRTLLARPVVRAGALVAVTSVTLMVRPAWAGGDHALGFWARFGVLHPALVHFPIALAITAACGELAGLLTGLEVLRKFAFVAILLAAIAVVPVYLTGHAAHELKGRMAASLAARVARHDTWGTATLWATLAAAALAVGSRLRPNVRALRVAGFALLLASAALAGFTGFLGAEVVRGPDHLAPLFETGSIPQPGEVVDLAGPGQRRSPRRDD